MVLYDHNQQHVWYFYDETKQPLLSVYCTKIKIKKYNYN